MYFSLFLKYDSSKIFESETERNFLKVYRNSEAFFNHRVVTFLKYVFGKKSAQQNNSQQLFT